MRFATTSVSALAIALFVSSCADAIDRTADDRESGGTIAVDALPPVATTSAPPASADSAPVASPVPPPTATTPTTEAPSTTVTTVTTVTVSSTVRPTTTVSPSALAPPCRLDLIVEQTQTQFLGITPSDLKCAAGWAAWIGRPDDELGDGFFAVARWTGTSWELMNLGSAGICADGGVPEDLWDQLGCFE